MFVMAADIRESTTLMKEAIGSNGSRCVMDQFVELGPPGIRRSGGWFDKFTGDGFLAYWIVQAAPPDEYEERFVQTAGDVAHTAHPLIELFHRRVLEDFRSNSRNLSAGRRAVDGSGRRARLPGQDRRRAHGRRPAGRRARSGW